MKKIKKYGRCLLVALAVLIGVNRVAAQGTALTYQGRLNADAGPANGFFDFEFKLYTNATGAGTQVDSTLTQTNIGVTNGLFSATLNFGDVFTGDATWLAISVRTNGGGSYTALSPFQELTPTPYAMYAPAAGAAASADSVAATNITGSITLAQLPATVLTDGEGGVTLSNVTVKGDLTLPSPATINSGGNSLLRSPGNNNFYAGQGAGNLTNLGSANTGIGVTSLQSNTNGANNTAIGYASLGDNLTGSDNTASGERALASNTRGSENTAGGYHAMVNNTLGSNNVAMGYEALAFNTNDSELVAIGYQALANNDAFNTNVTGSGYGENTAIGFNALQADTLGYQNTAIGYDALSTNKAGILNTAVGDRALSANTTGNYNTANGDHALFNNTIASDNTGLGAGALYYNTIGSYNTAIGDLALNQITNGAFNTAVGEESLLYINVGSYNTAIGEQSLLYNTSGTNNTALGAGALLNNSSGTNNLAVGSEAGIDLANGNNNIYVGNPGANIENGAIRIGTTSVQTKDTFMAGIYGTALPAGLGSPVFIDASGHLGTEGGNIDLGGINGNFFAGQSAGSNTSSGAGNTATGSDALFGNTIGSGNTADGQKALNDNIAGSDNVAVGNFALFANTNGSQNVAVGVSALGNSRNDDDLVAVGYQALQNDNASGNSSTSDGYGHNTGIGYNALQANTTGAGNTATGYEALSQNTNGIFNTAHGDNALSNNVLGSYNVAIGASAMQYTQGDSNEVAIGFEALQNDDAYENGATTSESGENTAIGHKALQENTLGYGNTAIGYLAMQGSVIGIGNTAIGDLALQAVTEGSLNTAIGYGALSGLSASSSGTQNIAIGWGAGGATGVGSYNIYIGNNGVSGDNNVIRIGDPGYQANDTLIAGIYGTSVPNQSLPVVINSSGHLGTGAVNVPFNPGIGDGVYRFDTTTAKGYYTTVGNLIYFEIWLQWVTIPSTLNQNAFVQISLPTSIASQRVSFPLGFTHGISFNNQLVAGGNNGENFIQLYSLGSNGTVQSVLVSGCATPGEIQISGSYRLY